MRGEPRYQWEDVGLALIARFFFHERFSAGYTERIIHAVGGRRDAVFLYLPASLPLTSFLWDVRK